MLARLAERGLLETAWEQAAPWPAAPPPVPHAGTELARSLSPEFVTRPGGGWPLPVLASLIAVSAETSSAGR
jgi:hypothetical protein